MFDVWMRLLARVEHSVLWLPRFNEAVVENLGIEAEKRGVSAERLVFARFVASPIEHMARLQAADLCLDTLPYNAHATACDALWVGLPLVTCMGRGFTGRVGASLLHAIGLPELVTKSLDAYEARASELASDRAQLAEVKTKLLRNRDSYPLFDTRRYTRHLEAAFTTMWQRCEADERPATFDVPRAP
jgi:predicted O-linked N-acetylglucosamine transferase (SPINDLY family)